MLQNHQMNMINMPMVSRETEKPKRQVIINIKIQNYGLHPSQRKHSLINLRGETKELFEVGMPLKVGPRHSSVEERNVASSAAVS